VTDSPYNNFPASLGNVTFGAGVRVGEYGTGSCYDNLTNQPRDLHVWSSASLGSELHTGPNAASDPSGSEANSTTGWTVWSGTLTSDNTAPLDVGSYYLKLSHATSLTNVSYNFGANMRGGRLYKLSFDHKATASHTIKMCNMGNGNVSFQETLPADASWTVHTIYFVAVTDTASDHLLFIYGPAGQTVRIDNLSLREMMGGDVVVRGLITGGGTSGIKVQSDGKVGIGTRSPSWGLDIASSSNGDGIQLNGNSGLDYSPGLRFADAGAFKGSLGVALATNAWIHGTSDGDMVLRSESRLILASGGDHGRIYITSDGKIGVGTDSPSQALDVAGNVTAANNTKVYDSGWFLVGAAGQYTTDHSLGGDPKGIVVYFSAVGSPGGSDIVSVAGPAARHDFAGSDYGAFVWLPNRSQLTVRAGNQVGWSSSWRTTGYYKIVAWR